MATVQSMLDRARVSLNDDAKTRWSDAELLSHYNDGINILKGERPDMFFGLFLSLPSDQGVGDTFPLEDTVRPAIQDYILARAMFKDSEEAVQGAATSFYSLFGATR